MDWRVIAITPSSMGIDRTICGVSPRMSWRDQAFARIRIARSDGYLLTGARTSLAEILDRMRNEFVVFLGRLAIEKVPFRAQASGVSPP